MKTSFVYVSCHRDLHWLSYSLRFLRRNWREPGTDIVVRIEEDCADVVKTWAVPDVDYHVIDRWPNGYHRQMHAKLTADQYTDADLIILIDSDTMLLGPCWLDDLMEDGKIVIEYLPWSGEAGRYWRGCSSAAIGFDIGHDLMIRPPFPLWRETFAATRARIEQTTGKSLRDLMWTETPFSVKDFATHRFPLADYECLNAYALSYETERYLARDARARISTWPFRVYWSWGDWSEDLQADFERRLSL